MLNFGLDENGMKLVYDLSKFVLEPIDKNKIGY